MNHTQKDTFQADFVTSDVSHLGILGILEETLTVAVNRRGLLLCSVVEAAHNEGEYCNI